MIQDFGLAGNGEVLARVRADGVLTEAYYPSVGFFRHVLQSQFGVRMPERGECLWLSHADFDTEQHYLGDTNVLQTSFSRPGLRGKLLDYVHPELPVHVRTLEVRNTGKSALHLDVFHAEASSIADQKGEFGCNVGYFDTAARHVVRYRGHPWHNAVEAQVVWLVCGQPAADTFQCGVSFQEGGRDLDAFLDVRDGALQENRYAAGDPTGTTSALLWRRELKPGETTSVTVFFAAGMSLFEAEDTLEEARRRTPDKLLGETVSYWRRWLEKGRRGMPVLPDERLSELYLRSLLLLKLLQDRKFGSLIAAPSLEPDYRYCWPRDGVFLAWALDRCGYHEEARHYYRWCRRTQADEGLWYQNHYTDGRRHWAGVQVDQGATIVWGMWQHFEVTGDREFLVEMWPTIQRAADYLLARTDPAVKLVYSEQDLWEETGGFLAYTNGASLAALEAASHAAREMGLETECARFGAAARSLRKGIRRQLLRDGHFAGERNALQRHPMRADYLLDISTLGLSVPFGVVPADSPEMLQTVRLLEQEIDYPIDGVGRYATDLFMGGNPWSLSAIWLGLYFAELGEIEEARRQVDWCLRHARLHDFMPEQSHRQTGLPAGATPLAWSHAWMIVLLQQLGRLTRSVEDLLPSGVSEPLPPAAG